MAHEYTLIVYTSPTDGREDDYNAWYDDVHLSEFCALPGVINGRRFKVAAADANAKPVYAAVYELSDHPDKVFAAMNEGIKAGSVHMTDALDVASLNMTTLEPR